MKVEKIVGIILILTCFTWGCNQGESSGNESNESKKETVGESIPLPVQIDTSSVEQVQLPVQQESPLGEADAFGRKPGDEHYGHSHGPQDQQPSTQPNPLVGEADKYGRKPGDEHYQHEHAPQDQQPKTELNPVAEKPDKHGRVPGDEHYGHDHGPQ